MTVKLLTEHHLEFLSLKGGCTGSPDSTLVKMPHCWKSYVEAKSLMVMEGPLHRGFSQNTPYNLLVIGFPFHAKILFSILTKDEHVKVPLMSINVCSTYITGKTHLKVFIGMQYPVNPFYENETTPM